MQGLSKIKKVLAMENNDDIKVFPCPFLRGLVPPVTGSFVFALYQLLSFFIYVPIVLTESPRHQA